MLLERGDVNPDLEDQTWFQTPLKWAAVRGNTGVVNVFLEREVVNPNQADSVYAAEALWYAAQHGREVIVKMLLERQDVNPNQIPTGYPCTPVFVAAVNGYQGVVKMLLEREDVDPNIADTRDGRTLLSDAASWGHEGIVKMLLDRNDIRIDIQDHENKTALSLGLSRGRDEIARMISERAASISNTADPSSEESLPPSAGDEDKFIADNELRDAYSNTNTNHPNREPTSSAADPMRRKGIGLRRLFSRFR